MRRRQHLFFDGPLLPCLLHAQMAELVLSVAASIQESWLWGPKVTGHGTTAMVSPVDDETAPERVRNLE